MRCLALRGRRWRLIAIIAAACAIVALSGCDEDDIERSLGEIASASIESSYTVVDDPALNRWITTMGETLVSYSRRQQVPYRFRVIDTDMVNAFAAPWGHIYVTTGLLEFAQDEEEVWGVVGHEIGHVVERHSIKSAKESFLFSIGVALLSRKNETLGQIAGLGLGLLSRRHSRDEEYSADDYGTQLAYMAGHDPRGNIAFFSRLFTDIEKGRRPSSIEVMFQTHPPTEDRIARQRAKPLVSGEEAAALLRVARGAMRRGRYAVALANLEQASRLAPQSAEVAAVWGDALIARGDGAGASARLEKAIAALGNDSYVRARLDLARGLTSGVLPAAGPDERAQATAALASSTALVARAAETQARVDAQQAASEASFAPLAASASRLNDQLMDLGGRGGGLSDQAQGALVAINAAVSQAADPIYSLEWLRAEAGRLATELHAAAQDGASVLAATGRGEGFAGEAAIAERSLRQVEHALGELDTVQAAGTEATTLAAKAQEAAAGSLVAAERIARSRGDDANLNAIARLSAREAQEAAGAAWAVIKDLRKTTRTARMRALVARLNLLALGQPPAAQEALDRLIAHFVLADAGEVARLRASGLGAGEAAVLLVSRAGTPADAEGAAAAPDGSPEAVDALLGQERVALGPRILLRFLLNAMSEEVSGGRPSSSEDGAARP